MSRRRQLTAACCPPPSSPLIILISTQCPIPKHSRRCWQTILLNPVTAHPEISFRLYLRTQSDRRDLRVQRGIHTVVSSSWSLLNVEFSQIPMEPLPPVPDPAPGTAPSSTTATAVRSASTSSVSSSAPPRRILSCVCQSGALSLSFSLYSLA